MKCVPTSGLNSNKQRIKALLLGDFSMKRIVRSMILIPLLIYIFLIFYALFYAERLIFQAPPSSYTNSREILQLTSKDGCKISALYLPNEKAKYTVLYSHGNAEDLGDVRPLLEEIRGLGFSVMAYDYHGYGTSEGKATERNAYEDIDAAYEYLVLELGIAAKHIVCFGHSLGAALAIDLASRKPVGALIVESSFTTAFRVLTRIPILPFDKFRNIDKIQKVGCPVLIVHGTSDQVISVAHGKALFEYAAEPKRLLLLDGAGHNDITSVAMRGYPAILHELGLASN